MRHWLIICVLAALPGVALAQMEPGDPIAGQRLAATWAMGELTDGLQRVFASQASPLRLLRNQGMTALNRLPALKRWLTARALGA